MTIAGTRPVPPVSRTAARQNDSRPRSGNALAILHLQERALDVKNFSGFCVVSVSGAFVLQLGAMCSVAGDVRRAPKAGRKRCCPHGLEPCQPTLGLFVPGRASSISAPEARERAERAERGERLEPAEPKPLPNQKLAPKSVPKPASKPAAKPKPKLRPASVGRPQACDRAAGTSKMNKVGDALMQRYNERQ